MYTVYETYPMKSSQTLVFMALGLLKGTPHYLIDMASFCRSLGKTSMNGAIFHRQSQRQSFMSDQQCSKKTIMHF